MTRDYSNPFTPVVGKVPLYMAGRETIIADVEAALSGAGNDPAIISLLVGARGTGKTALLSRFADTAESIGWVTARVTCVPGMLDDILIRTLRAARHLVDTSLPRRSRRRVSQTWHPWNSRNRSRGLPTGAPRSKTSLTPWQNAAQDCS